MRSAILHQPVYCSILSKRSHLRLLVRYKDAARVANYLGLDYAAIQEAIEEELRLKAKLPVPWLR